MPKTLWFDVEDLFEYITHNRRPSGIQRLAFELYRVLQERHGADGRVRFVRLDPMRKNFVSVPWKSIADLFSQLSDDAGSSSGAGGRTSTSHLRRGPTLRGHLRRLVHRLPFEMRYRLLDATRLQIDALFAFGDLGAFLARSAMRRTSRTGRAIASGGDALTNVHAANDEFVRTVKAGDTLLAFGAPWSYADHADLIETARARFGIKFGFLVYDIIALRRPEWFEKGLVQRFREWFVSILPLADFVFAISKYTADDVTRFARQYSIPLRNPVQMIPIGNGFGPSAPGLPAPYDDLPPPGSYVLFVSTIEARKNHMLLFRIWRQLLEELPASAVPTLVFAGRVGWLVADLRQQLENTDYLDHKIIVMSDLSDARLGQLYRGCLFTVFPSHYEGWGLPVSESLAFGKPCLASNKSAIPEAGGKFCRYFDPDDLNAAYRLVRDTVKDRDGLAAWEAEIRREFKPTSWEEGAQAILHGVGMDSGG